MKYIAFDYKDKNFINVEDNELKLFNDKWYNIYQVLNNFKYRRVEEEVLELNYIWIDIDYLKYNYLEELLTFIKSNTWLTPSKINETYKGYHLFFRLENKNLNTLIYKDLYNSINSKLNGDKNMKSITWILKVEGFVDNKNNRNFIIKNIFNSENVILEEDIKRLLNIKTVKYENRLEKYESKLENKKITNEIIEEIDAVELISYLNDSWYTIEVKNATIANKWVLTSGLKLYNNNGKYEIKDFSWHTRFGIRNFLLNFVLKDLIGDNKVKEYVKILSHFNIFLNTNYKLSSKFPLYTVLWFKKDEIVSNINDKIVGEDKGIMLKCLIWYTYLSKELNTEYIKEREIIELLWLSVSKNSKDKIRGAFIKLSYLKIKTECKVLLEDKIVNKEEFRNMFNVEIIKGSNNGEVSYNVSFLNKLTKYINLNIDLLKIKNDNKFYASLILTSNLQINGAFKINIEELKELTWLNSYDTIRDRYLKELKEEKIIKRYKKEWNYIIYS